MCFSLQNPVGRVAGSRRRVGSLCGTGWTGLPCVPVHTPVPAHVCPEGFQDLSLELQVVEFLERAVL